METIINNQIELIKNNSEMFFENFALKNLKSLLENKGEKAVKEALTGVLKDKFLIPEQTIFFTELQTNLITNKK